MERKLENSAEITDTSADVWELTSVAVQCDKFKFTLNFKRVRKLIAFFVFELYTVGRRSERTTQIPDHLREMKRLSREAGNNRDR